MDTSWRNFVFLFLFFLWNRMLLRATRFTRHQVLVSPTAAVLVSHAESIVRSLTNMAADDSNGYLKSNYMLNINNRRTKHYTYSYIHVRTFTKTEPVSFSNPTMQPCLLVKPASRRLQRLLLF